MIDQDPLQNKKRILYTDFFDHLSIGVKGFTIIVIEVELVSFFRGYNERR